MAVQTGLMLGYLGTPKTGPYQPKHETVLVSYSTIVVRYGTWNVAYG